MFTSDLCGFVAQSTRPDSGQILRHQTSLLAKRTKRRGARRKGCFCRLSCHELLVVFGLSTLNSTRTNHKLTNKLASQKSRHMFLRLCRIRTRYCALIRRRSIRCLRKNRQVCVTLVLQKLIRWYSVKKKKKNQKVSNIFKKKTETFRVYDPSSVCEKTVAQY